MVYRTKYTQIAESYRQEHNKMFLNNFVCGSGVVAALQNTLVAPHKLCDLSDKFASVKPIHSCQINKIP